MTRLKFWGVRGSIPTPGPTTLRYGGNTSCTELRHGDTLFILDAGSGIRALGQELIRRKETVKASIFISHMHWDHIQGIPFFTPAFIPDNKFTFYGAEESDKELYTIIADQMDPTYFPIELSDMGSRLEFRRLNEGRYEIDGIPLETIYVNHPGNALGYKFTFGQKQLVYISDNEPFEQVPEGRDASEYIGEDGNKKLIDFISGADILIHDAQYTPQEYKSHITWGHSPYDYVVDLAVQSSVKKLILFHHDPLHNDDKIDEMLSAARDIAGQKDGALEILAAKEGFEIEF